MKRTSCRLASTLVAVWLASATLAAAQEPKLIRPPQQAWTNVLADSRPTVEFAVQAPAGFQGRVTWTVADAATKRVLPKGRGELVVKPGANVKFALDIPEVNPGVVMKAHLTVSLVDDATGKVRAAHDKDLWIFPADPFHGLSTALAELKILVYDPAGKSAAALKALKVPFEEAKNADALGERQGGVVVIGEGVSFTDEPGLAEALTRLAQQGATVICLAPSAAAWPIPNGDKNGGESIRFLRHDAITKLDPRLDGVAWSNGTKIAARTIVLKAVDGSVVGAVGDGPDGFPWMQIDYPQTNGRLTVCGFGLIAHWQETPTPRYLFAKMLGVAMPSPSPESQAAR